MKSILLHVAEDAGMESRLQAALDLARGMSGHLECLITRRVPAYLGVESGFSGGGALMVEMMAEDEKAAAATRARLEPRLAAEGLPFSFSEALGEPAQTLTDWSLLTDVVVMSLPDAEHRALAAPLGAVVTGADAPVLAVPVGWQRLELERPVLLAWKPTSEAAAALKASLPLLQAAGKVDILIVDAPDGDAYAGSQVARYLSRHGVHAEVHERASGGASVADTLGSAALELGSGMMVMGGYGRSRAMEFLLGGVTRRLLAASPLPLLMAH